MRQGQGEERVYDVIQALVCARELGVMPPQQLMSVWSSYGEVERHSRRIRRSLTTAASMRMRAARSMLNDPSEAQEPMGGVRRLLLCASMCCTAALARQSLPTPMLLLLPVKSRRWRP